MSTDATTATGTKLLDSVEQQVRAADRQDTEARVSMIADELDVSQGDVIHAARVLRSHGTVHFYQTGDMPVDDAVITLTDDDAQDSFAAGSDHVPDHA